jgi:uncharacterized protein (DUF952 family)/uncharacterized protein (DUF1330 family)
MLIFKIFRADEWAAFVAQGETQGAPIDLQDGFIHFSTAPQAAETAAKHFAGAEGLWLLAFDAAQMGEALKWEVSRGGALFPHLYRSMQLDEVAWIRPLPLVDGVHQFPEGFTGYGDPERAQFDTFKALDRDEPIEMLNLVKFRDQATYPADHPLAETSQTGAEAYANYGRDTAAIIDRLGASIVWRGSFAATLIGPSDEVWDEIFVARYPSAHAFLSMVTDPDYRKAVVHRQAAVATSRLIRCAPTQTGNRFG